MDPKNLASKSTISSEEDDCPKFVDENGRVYTKHKSSNAEIRESINKALNVLTDKKFKEKVMLQLDMCFVQDKMNVLEYFKAKPKKFITNLYAEKGPLQTLDQLEAMNFTLYSEDAVPIWLDKLKKSRTDPTKVIAMIISKSLAKQLTYGKVRKGKTDICEFTYVMKIIRYYFLNVNHENKIYSLSDILADIDKNLKYMFKNIAKWPDMSDPLVRAKHVLPQQKTHGEYGHSDFQYMFA